eukprot:CAMPEP_0185729644 /NCGR_PEP_ID=MMETSP1171-20130828/6778_1 /TAXON_ID=374046 /ORGANISM="Helicotheca tamensis, Strain CCMP826" /LENGTH=252 /DNA_ID=CAMNT_0028398535 /DNA_START=177 /DNA_END=935 /DNA_ORIENTATION=+
MFELLKVNSMCGVCCFSMKTIVALDLLAVAILPASMLYVVFFLYMTFVMGEPMSQMLVILYGIIIGVQLVVFIVRSRWDYLWWFLMFVVFGVPVFYFILPLYAFWHMDDFSWGNTRMVAKSAVKETEEEVEDQDSQSKSQTKTTGTTDEDQSLSSPEKAGSSDDEGSVASMPTVEEKSLVCGSIQLDGDVIDKPDDGKADDQSEDGAEKVSSSTEEDVKMSAEPATNEVQDDSSKGDEDKDAPDEKGGNFAI